MADRKEETQSLAESNRNAVATVLAAVQGTLGPKGMDTMLIDRFDRTFITNDGYTILDKMAVSHPVAKLLVGVAKAQEESVGDGTTTTALLAGHIILAGYDAMARGVAPAVLLDGLQHGGKLALSHLETLKKEAKEETLLEVATIAARGDRNVAQLALEAFQKSAGNQKEHLLPLKERVEALQGAEGEVLEGILIKKEPLLWDMPKTQQNVGVLTIDDAFVPEELPQGIYATPEGYRHYELVQQRFQQTVQQIIESGVGVVLVNRALDAKTEAAFAAAGILAVPRITRSDLEKIRLHTDAKLIRMAHFARATWQEAIGHAKEVSWCHDTATIRLLGGRGVPMATLVVGAATPEVLEERARIASDALASLESATAGVLPGGGATELALARHLEEQALEANDALRYGMRALADALRRPFLQMCSNAGLEGLEKLALVEEAERTQGYQYGLDFHTGKPADMEALGVYDAYRVKENALNLALEVAQSVLRLRILVRAKDAESQVKE